MRMFMITVCFAVTAVLLSSCGSDSPSHDETEPAEAVVKSLDAPASESLDAAPLESSAVGVQEFTASAADMTVSQFQQLRQMRRGKPLFVNVWSTQCPPCVKEMPYIIEMYETYKDKVDFLALSADGFSNTERLVPAMMKRLEMTLPTRILQADDARDAMLSVDEEWKGALPATFIYDETGRIAKRQIGAQTKRYFELAIQEVLGETAGEQG